MQIVFLCASHNIDTRCYENSAHPDLQVFAGLGRSEKLFGLTGDKRIAKHYAANSRYGNDFNQQEVRDGQAGNGNHIWKQTCVEKNRLWV